jgi:hypothetical protein
LGVLIFRQAAHTPQLCVLLLPVLVCAATERPWSLGSVDWLSWSLPAIILSLSRGTPLAPERFPPRVPPSRRSRQQVDEAMSGPPADDRWRSIARVSRV